MTILNQYMFRLTWQGSRGGELYAVFAKCREDAFEKVNQSFYKSTPNVEYVGLVVGEIA